MNVSMDLSKLSQAPLTMNVSMDLSMRAQEKLRMRYAKATQTMKEKAAYIVLQDNQQGKTNSIYEIETETRQELLALATPYMTTILSRFITCSEFDEVTAKYPRWMENIFTRNTVESNIEYMEYLTLAPAWYHGQWNEVAFSLFCQKLHRELSSLVMACEIIPGTLAELKMIVQHVSEENLFDISEIGYKFGQTEDDDGSHE